MISLCLSKEHIGLQLGEKIGLALKVELDNENTGWRVFLRIRVKLNIHKPMTRVVHIALTRDGKRETFRVAYEKLPKFCAVCGLLGHVHTECGSGVHDKRAFQYRDWLIATPDRGGIAKINNPAGPSESQSSGARVSGLGIKDSNKQYDLKGEEESNSRNSQADVDRQEDNRRALVLVPNQGNISDLGARDETFVTHPTYEEDKYGSSFAKDVKNRGLKRLRKEEDNKGIVDFEMGSAGSLEEYRRAQ
jgi:hypothetical protein